MSKKKKQPAVPPEERADQVPAPAAEPAAEDAADKADTPAPAPESAAADSHTDGAAAQQASPAASIEAFLPTDYYTPDASDPSRKRRRTALLLAGLALLVALGAAAIVYWNRLNNDPSGFFPSAEAASPTPTQAPADVPATPSPTPDPYAALEQQADLSMMQNIVNIMLIGADYAEERESWGGKDGLSAAHADVMIVLAVNFDNNTANLISLPRDTYTTVPGVSGIYKLNGSLDCGGGLLAADGAGFKKVCETASFLLGGIPIDYYYAVTMPAVKELVDAIGGVDYRLEISFTMQGRSYGAGNRHMNGQAVLDYLRVRKTASGLEPGQTGDAQRVKRQKKMLLAIFNQLKKKNMMLKVPEILSAFEGQLFTNCSASQTAALALYGYNMPSENIGMHSMSGRMRSLYSWNFSFINQDNRIALIKEIYGVDVPVIREITDGYATNVYRTKIANQYINTCSPLTKYVAALLKADDLLPEFTMTPSPSPTPTAAPSTPSPTVAPSSVPDPTAAPTPAPSTPTPAATETPASTDSGTIPVGAPAGVAGMPGVAAPDASALLADRAGNVRQEEVRKYTASQRSVYSKYLEALDRCKSLRGGSTTADANALASASAALKSAAIRCASTFGYTGKLTWTIPPLANTNEIYVDFR